MMYKHNIPFILKHKIFCLDLFKSRQIHYSFQYINKRKYSVSASFLYQADPICKKRLDV